MTGVHDFDATPVEEKSKRRSEKELSQKRIFEREREKIESEIPEHVTEKFGRIFFSKWSGDVFPVLVLNPFSIPPGLVRDTWSTMFEKVSFIDSHFEPASSAARERHKHDMQTNTTIKRESANGFDGTNFVVSTCLFCFSKIGEGK